MTGLGLLSRAMLAWPLVASLHGCGGGGEPAFPARGGLDLGGGIAITADGQILVDVPRPADPRLGDPANFR